MAGTYSLTFNGTGHNAGYPAPNPQQPAMQIDDANASPNTQLRIMSENRQLNAQGPDGVQRKYTIDASRSDPSKNLIYLLLV
jgi:hypothetical protein